MKNAGSCNSSNYFFLLDNAKSNHLDEKYSKYISDNFAVTWKKDDNFMYQEGKRIVILPNNTLVIHDANVNDTSDDYECSIMHPKKTVTIKHRVQVVSQVPPTQRVDVTSERPQVLPTDTQRMDAASERPLVPPSIHHKQSEIRVIPGKRVEVNAGDNVTLGCETRIQPIPEIKWYHEVRYFYSTPYYVHIYRGIQTF